MSDEDDNDCIQIEEDEEEEGDKEVWITLINNNFIFIERNEYWFK